MASKIPQITRFRDNSEDNVSYEVQSDEKALLEQHEAANLCSKKGWRRRITFTNVLAFVLLPLSVIINASILLERPEIQNPNKDPFEDYGKCPSRSLYDVGKQC